MSEGSGTRGPTVGWIRLGMFGLGVAWALALVNGPFFYIGRTPIGLAAGLAALILAGMAWGLRSPARAERMVARMEEWLSAPDRIAGLIGVGVLTLFVPMVLRHWAFQTSAFDLRVHEELIRNIGLGRGFYSDLLGRSFLGHHVVPLFAILTPFYGMWPSPYFLFIVQALLVGGAAWWIWRLAGLRGLRPLWAGLTVCLFLTYRGLTPGYFLGFNPEVASIFFVLGFLVAEAEGHYRRAWIWAVMSLICREDVAVFMLVAGLIGMTRPGAARRWGAATAGIALAWAAICYGVIIPGHHESGGMAEFDRWARWGATPAGIVWGWLTHPMETLRALAGPALKLPALLAFLPLLDGRAVAVMALPWLVNATSAFALQAKLGGAYAALFVPWLMDGWIRQSARPAIQAWLASPRRLIFCAAVLAVINLRQPPDPRFPAGWRAAHAELRSLRRTGRLERVLAQGCLLPQVGWPQSAELLGAPSSPIPGLAHTRVLLAPDLDPWPLTSEAIRKIDADLRGDPRWRRREAGPLVVWEPAPMAGKESESNR